MSSPTARVLVLLCALLLAPRVLADTVKSSGNKVTGRIVAITGDSLTLFEACQEEVAPLELEWEDVRFDQQCKLGAPSALQTESPPLPAAPGTGMQAAGAGSDDEDTSRQVTTSAERGPGACGPDAEGFVIRKVNASGHSLLLWTRTTEEPVRFYPTPESAETSCPRAQYTPAFLTSFCNQTALVADDVELRWDDNLWMRLTDGGEHIEPRDNVTRLRKVFRCLASQDP